MWCVRMVIPAVEIQVFVAGITSIEQQLFAHRACPVGGAADVAPGIEARFLLHVAFGIGDGRPAAEVIICQCRFHCSFSVR